MLRFRQLRGRTRTDAARGLAKVRELLPPEYRPLTGPAIESQAATLAVDAAGLRYSVGDLRRLRLYSNAQMLAGEAYVKDGELYGVIIKRPSETLVSPERAAQSAVWAGYVGYSLEGSQRTDEFEQAVATAFNANLEELVRTSERTRLFLNEQRTHADAPTGPEVSAAGVLKDKSARTLMQAIKASGGLLVSDLPKQLPAGDRARIDEIQEKLLSSSLLEQETVIVCSKARTPVLRYASDEDAEALAALNVRCSCGQPVQGEKRERSVTVTKLGRSLVDKSRWMTVLLVEELRSLGVPLEHIFIEQLDGGDEMDCLAVIAGDTVLFELKDKEFSLGHAYSFAAKVGILRPDLSAVITTDKVGNDAREHFERAKKASMEGSRQRTLPVGSAPVFVEGVERLQDELRAIGSTLTLDDANMFFEDVFLQAALSPSRFIAQMSATDAASGSVEAVLPKPRRGGLSQPVKPAGGEA
ncbi:hypothetical protein OG994_26330 [Micromonospora globbae]|uniref:DUF4263 domain-containing protein n=1 Tax=Micromonospora globbae TaxID=1894969 RepID=A0ABZ1S3M2_9ACTN|nr:hypothetical protein [Micromonospora globbae]